jgi:hypothetical protein
MANLVVNDSTCMERTSAVSLLFLLSFPFISGEQTRDSELTRWNIIR